MVFVVAHASALTDVQAQALRNGLKWLCGRSPQIAGEPAPFFTDAVALLGLALGARFLQGDEMTTTSRWLRAPWWRGRDTTAWSTN
jgi:hypothetical protein